MKKTAAALGSVVSFLISSALLASTTAPPQVQIESKIVYVTKTERDFGVDFGFVITPLPDGTTRLEVSALARGKGANFRNWVPESPVLILPDKQTLTPVESAPMYVAKKSIVSSVAPILFAAIGTQYEPYAERAASSPGTPCSTGGSHENDNDPRSDGAVIIDKAGMTAGLGLLTAQAKGELEGQRSTFIVPARSGVPVLGELPLIGTLFRTKVRNDKERELVIVITPIITLPEEP